MRGAHLGRRGHERLFRAPAAHPAERLRLRADGIHHVADPVPGRGRVYERRQPGVSAARAEPAVVRGGGGQSAVHGRVAPQPPDCGRKHSDRNGRGRLRRDGDWTLPVPRPWAGSGARDAAAFLAGDRAGLGNSFRVADLRSANGHARDHAGPCAPRPALCALDGPGGLEQLRPGARACLAQSRSWADADILQRDAAPHPGRRSGGSPGNLPVVLRQHLPVPVSVQERHVAAADDAADAVLRRSGRCSTIDHRACAFAGLPADHRAQDRSRQVSAPLITTSSNARSGARRRAASGTPAADLVAPR